MEAVATFMIYLTCYLVTCIVTGYVNKKNSNRLFKPTGELAWSTEKLVSFHFISIVFLGLIPLLLFKKPSFSIISIHNNLPASWLVLFTLTGLLLLITGFSNGSRILIQKNILPNFNHKFLKMYYPARILFLGSYELFFRGFLLFDLKYEFGNITAITITTLLTVILHVFTNRQEMLACIPFGIILSLFCISTNSAWPAMILHTALSFSYELPVVHQFAKNINPGK